MRSSCSTSHFDIMPDEKMILFGNIERNKSQNRLQMSIYYPYEYILIENQFLFLCFLNRMKKFYINIIELKSCYECKFVSSTYTKSHNTLNSCNLIYPCPNHILTFVVGAIVQLNIIFWYWIWWGKWYLWQDWAD